MYKGFETYTYTSEGIDRGEASNNSSYCSQAKG